GAPCDREWIDRGRIRPAEVQETRGKVGAGACGRERLPGGDDSPGGAVPDTVQPGAHDGRRDRQRTDDQPARIALPRGLEPQRGNPCPSKADTEEHECAHAAVLSARKIAVFTGTYAVPAGGTGEPVRRTRPLSGGGVRRPDRTGCAGGSFGADAAVVY